MSQSNCLRFYCFYCRVLAYWPLRFARLILTRKVTFSRTPIVTAEITCVSTLDGKLALFVAPVIGGLSFFKQFILHWLHPTLTCFISSSLMGMGHGDVQLGNTVSTAVTGRPMAIRLFPFTPSSSHKIPALATLLATSSASAQSGTS